MDIIIFSNTWEEHKETVRQVLQRFSQHDITLIPSKCSFGKNKTEFIGHVIENGTITPNEARVMPLQMQNAQRQRNRYRAS